MLQQVVNLFDPNYEVSLDKYLCDINTIHTTESKASFLFLIIS